MGHTWLVDKLLLGHTVRLRVRVGSTGHCQDNTRWCVSRFIGSDPTHDFRLFGLGV